MKEKMFLNAAEAARKTGLSKSAVQQHVKQGEWSFAKYYPGKNGKGRYEIPTKKLYDYAGIPYEKKDFG